MRTQVLPNWEARKFEFGLSQAQEARAAQLHRDSIIFDMGSRYAGSAIFDHYPRALQSDLETRLAALDSSAEVLAETIYWPFEMALLGKSDLIREWLQASGQTCGVYETILHADHGLPDPLTWGWEEKINRYTKLPWLRYAKNAREIRQAKLDGAIALYANCQPIIPAPRNLKAFDIAYAKGLRSFMLTYNRMDHIGVGCTERIDAGLSMFGVEVVRHLNALGILVDVSHCGHRTTMDACRYSRQPVTANHTLARSLHDHVRGKRDEALRAIADTGGVIGVVAVPFFLSAEASASIEQMLDQIDHIANIVGWQHVAIGTDYPWPLPQDVLAATVGGEHNKSAGFRPEDRIDRSQRLIGLEDCRDLINFTRGLVKRGYGDEQIRGILGENALRVFETVCG